MVRAQPMDAVVLVGGCDKTVPAQLMGAASADIPAIQLVGGPMSTSRHRGERLGACTDCRRFWARYRAGAVSAETEIRADRAALGDDGRHLRGDGNGEHDGVARRSARHDALGRRGDSRRRRGSACGWPRRPGGVAVSLIGSGLRPSRIITQKAIDNAMRVLLAIGGSTNAIIHLAAIAGPARPDGRPQANERNERDDAGSCRSEADRRWLYGGSSCRGRHSGGVART